VLPAEPKKDGFRPAQLFTGGRMAMTVLLWLVYLVTLASLNTLNNWLPVALTWRAWRTTGGADHDAIPVRRIAGVLLLGFFSDRLGYPRVLILAL
jgi:AAHS family 4-hydroxybenzoate transporter-like MFS transporter